MQTTINGLAGKSRPFGAKRGSMNAIELGSKLGGLTRSNTAKNGVGLKSMVVLQPENKRGPSTRRIDLCKNAEDSHNQSVQVEAQKYQSIVVSRRRSPSLTTKLGVKGARKATISQITVQGKDAGPIGPVKSKTQVIVNPVKNVQLELFEDPEKEEQTKICKDDDKHSTPSTKKSDSVKSQKSVGTTF